MKWITRLATLSLACMVGCGDDGGSVDAGPIPMNQCVNPNDLAITAQLIAMATDGGVPDAGSTSDPYTGYLAALAGELAECARGDCLSVIFAEGDVAGCMSTCLEGELVAGLSVGCTQCNTDVVGCAANNCIVECLTPDNPDCTVCNEENCTPQLEICTGLESDG